MSSFISNYIYQYFTQKQVLSIFQGLKLVSLASIGLLIFGISPIFILFYFFLMLFLMVLQTQLRTQ